jgi:hypothetical protein
MLKPKVAKRVLANSASQLFTRQCAESAPGQYHFGGGPDMTNGQKTAA